MDKAEQTMTDNLQKNTGKSLDEWIAIVRESKIDKHGEIISFLKEKHSFTYGFANLVALKTKGSDAGSAVDTGQLITRQYKGKEHFKPLYDLLLSEILKFGKDIEISPKNAYVSLRRKKQFAILQPATKTRFEIGLNLKGEAQTGILETITLPNSMCSHRINLTSDKEVTEEVLQWLKKSYQNAG